MGKSLLDQKQTGEASMSSSLAAIIRATLSPSVADRNDRAAHPHAAAAVNRIGDLNAAVDRAVAGRMSPIERAMRAGGLGSHEKPPTSPAAGEDAGAALNAAVDRLAQ
jgi:hypothetical protein